VLLVEVCGVDFKGRREDPRHGPRIQPARLGVDQMYGAGCGFAGANCVVQHPREQRIHINRLGIGKNLSDVVYKAQGGLFFLQQRIPFLLQLYAPPEVEIQNNQEDNRQQQVENNG
jgi:hypothetical protein